MPDLFDVIELTVDIPEQKLYTGMQGTIVEHHSGDAYEVEFTDESGKTLTSLALQRPQFIVVWRAKSGVPVPIVEQVIALMEELPETAGQEVLDFARFLYEKGHRTKTHRAINPT